jgi:chorismate mutase/prephenate dehydratase
MSSNPEEPADLAAELAALDRSLVELLNRRVQVEARQRSTAPAGEPYQPAEDAQIYRRVAEANAGPLPPAALTAIYREILSASQALTRPLRVGYLGPEATFTYEAARSHFGAAAMLVPLRSISDVFSETQRRAVDYGVVPTENSTEGSVPHTLDRFLDTELQICAEVKLPISHNLLSHGRLEQIRRVYSHPQALAQCRRWLAEHLPNAEQIEAASTSAAAQLAREPETAAIATRAASALYGVPIVAAQVEDGASNVTRFVVIGHHAAARTGHDRTAVVFGVDDRVGALHAALSRLAAHGINLTRIESRPSRRRNWEYVFFVDLDGHPDDDPVRQALAELCTAGSFVRVLGAWPLASIVG